MSFDLTKLRDPQRRAVRLARLRKKVVHHVKPSHPSATPVFVLGLQRSGTNMIMDVLHLRADTEVYSESRDSVAFNNYLLRELEIVDRLIEDSRSPYVCFKPIADSHRVHELMARYSEAHFIWIYRAFQDVANSRLRAFPHATRAIRLACRGETGGGWFDEGLSPETRRILREFDVERLSDFDLACLTWWARNRICIERALWQYGKVAIVRYEKLAADPATGFSSLFEFLAMPASAHALRFIRATSIGRHEAPPLDAEVETLCHQVLAELDRHAI